MTELLFEEVMVPQQSRCFFGLNACANVQREVIITRIRRSTSTKHAEVLIVLQESAPKDCPAQEPMSLSMHMPISYLAKRMTLYTQ